VADEPLPTGLLVSARLLPPSCVFVFFPAPSQSTTQFDFLTTHMLGARTSFPLFLVNSVFVSLFQVEASCLFFFPSLLHRLVRILDRPRVSVPSDLIIFYRACSPQSFFSSRPGLIGSFRFESPNFRSNSVGFIIDVNPRSQCLLVRLPPSRFLFSQRFLRGRRIEALLPRTQL